MFRPHLLKILPNHRWSAETLARGQDAAITTGLLSGVKKPASSHGTRSRRSGASTRRSGDATERGRKKSASGKSSKEALRRKAERRAYKPVTFTLLCRLFCLYASFMALVFAFVIVTALGAYLNPTGEVLELNALENVVWMIISVASFIASRNRGLSNFGPRQCFEVSSEPVLRAC